MIKFLSERTARYLASDDDAAEDIEVIEYGYYMLYQQWLVTIAILLVSLPFGLFFPVLASLVTSMVLRGYTCGTHATHPLICKATSFVIAFTPAILAVFFADRLALIAIVVMYLISIALLIKYAPGDTDVKKIHNPKIRMQMKIQSIVTVTIFILAAILIQSRFPEIAFVVVVTAFITCCFVHPWAYWLFGFDPVTKEARKPIR